MEKQQQNLRPQNNSPPLPYESSVSSFSPSSFSHDGEGPQHSLHPSPTPQQELHPTKTRSADQVNLWFRVFGFLFCLISFSIMAADRNKGWTLDSFHRYIEFRYCLTVNVIGFIYSALQGFGLAQLLFSSDGKIIVFASHLRYIVDFASDQILAYLLMSSSSSAATELKTGNLTGVKTGFRVWLMHRWQFLLWHLCPWLLALSSLVIPYALYKLYI